ncbi:RNA ligase [Candidatus Micrarchaeota archaeon]|nr:RNA ligase [Candidatus Micrarchaeota archaeon]
MKDLKASLRKKILNAIKKGRIQERDGVCRFSESIGKIPRGTVVTGKRVIYGYPKIRRVFSLEKGVQKNLHEGEIFVEEKIDGYNLRTIYEGGKIMCISRGGFLDFFATEKLSDDENAKAFFAAHPNKVLYMEMVGNTPYTKAPSGTGAKYYVFDMGDGKNNYLSPKERRKLCNDYGLNPVPLVKRVGGGNRSQLKKLAISLDKKGAEGMVLKQENPRRILKYVLPSSDIRDLAENSHLIFDMPLGFMKQRVFRCAASVNELGLNKKQYDARMGEALHCLLYSALTSGGEAAEEFEFTIKNRETWGKLLSHMSKEVEIRDVRETNLKGALIIRFKKKYKEGSRKIRRAIEGYAQAD